MRTDADGHGVINLLEVGDPVQPKLVFFFDEAHLLFNDAPPALLAKIEQVVRLMMHSKGVGIYFVTQNPLDIPDSVLGQPCAARIARLYPARSKGSESGSADDACESGFQRRDGDHLIGGR